MHIHLLSNGNVVLRGGRVDSRRDETLTKGHLNQGDKERGHRHP